MARRISNIGLFIVSIKSMAIGLRLTLKHFFVSIGVKRKPQVGVMDASYFMHKEGIVTNLYPHESIPVPDNGRYRLHNEVDDCIVCDLCAKVCPVNCIDIEPIKSPVEIGKTSDGSTKRIYAATFDIDMAKCCFCGLCTTVCPTECLTMTKTYDFSEYNVSNMVYHFAELSPAEGVLKREEMEILTAEEKAKKTAAVKPVSTDAIEKTETTSTASKPTFKPKVAIPAVKKPETDAAIENKEVETTSAKTEESSTETSVEKPAAPKPVFKPKVVIPAKKTVTPKEGEVISEEKVEAKTADEATTSTTEEVVSKPKPVMKPVIPKIPSTESTPEAESSKAENTSVDTTSQHEVKPAAKPKPIMKPVMKPIIPKKSEEGGETNA
jgi:formate hydrogenlyase subunit 6/NADH:ubiquinone oxidoreductase subunit I